MFLKQVFEIVCIITAADALMEKPASGGDALIEQPTYGEDVLIEKSASMVIH